jgi:hypothetical protein
VSGALTERAFVERLAKTGFADIEVLERQTYGVSDLEAEPLFPRDLIEVMRRLIKPEVQERIGVRIVVAAKTSPSRLRRSQRTTG